MNTALHRVALAAMILAGLAVAWLLLRRPAPAPIASPEVPFDLQPRQSLDTSGFFTVSRNLQRWKPDATLEELAALWKPAGQRMLAEFDRQLAGGVTEERRLSLEFTKAVVLHYDARPREAYQQVSRLRKEVEGRSDWAEESLATILFLQGVSALRMGETENCIACRGESSCILPVAQAAQHQRPEGSRLAIRHFTEYLEHFPDDRDVRWLLNLAHMTVGEYPHAVDPRHRIPLDRLVQSEFNIGAFRDVGDRVGLNRFNQSGGAILEDFDNDGLLDVATTALDPAMPMAFYRQTGQARFQDATQAAGCLPQLGGLYCVQTDFNNDGWKDVFIVRGAWQLYPMRLSLLQNQGDGTFLDVTEAAGLTAAFTSSSASWADYDNDGCLDVFICSERSPGVLYRSRGDGTFEDVTRSAHLRSEGRTDCKGAAWIDYDNDGFSDLFLNFLIESPPQLFHNERNGQFTDQSQALHIDGPGKGFSCWTWDYDNDGWQDLFATRYEGGPKEFVSDLLGEPRPTRTNRLFRNRQGEGFEDTTRAAGLDGLYAAMGSNFADFDNDGFLDMYLGTGDPNLSTLVPNRMFKNVRGVRFSEITASARTGHLQKGHAVACGDWDRDGDVDVFIQMGGAVNGDRYHNVLFNNPGQPHRSVTIALAGETSNRAAIGARVRIVTGGDTGQTICRHVSSGSSFGANPLEMTIGIGEAEQIDVLEITWPASGQVQTLKNLPAGRRIQIVEGADGWHVLPGASITLRPTGSAVSAKRPEAP